MGLLYNACVWVGFAQDAEVPPPVGSGAGVLLEPQRALGLEEARMSGHVGAPAMDATPLLKRKGEEAPQPWLDVDGVPIPATKIRRLVRTSLSPSLSLSLSQFCTTRSLTCAFVLVLLAQDADVPPVGSGMGVPLAEPGVSVAPQPFVAGDLRMSGDVAPPAAAIAVAAPAVNEERAIVVYQPAEAERNLLDGPLRPGASLRVSPDWIHGLKSTCPLACLPARLLLSPKLIWVNSVRC